MIKPGLWDDELETRFFRVRMRSGRFHIRADPERSGALNIARTDPALLRWMGEHGHSCLDEIPIEKDFIGGICEHCGAPGVELHHWAPRMVFGAEADDWPTGDLCPPCHAEWHERMNAWADGKRPLGWEGVGIVE